MQNSSQIQSPQRECESASLWTHGNIYFCGVYRTVVPPIAMQVPSPWTGILFHATPQPGVSRNCAVQVLPCHVRTPGLQGQVNAPTQTRLQGQEFVMNFAWDMEGIESRGRKPQSPMVSDLNHSANHMYTIGTKCSNHVTGMFGTNRIYTVGRVVKGPRPYETRTCSRVGLISSVSQCKIHHKFFSLEASLSGRIHLSM